MIDFTREVVIVDDDLDHAIIARTVLASVAPRTEVRTITDPHDVERRLLEVEHDSLVLIDRVLGRHECYDVIERVSAGRPDLRFVMLSAALSPEDGQRALRAGAAEAAQKPGSIAGWRDLLGGLLARAGGHRTDADAVA